MKHVFARVLMLALGLCSFSSMAQDKCPLTDESVSLEQAVVGLYLGMAESVVYEHNTHIVQQIAEGSNFQALAEGGETMYSYTTTFKGKPLVLENMPGHEAFALSFDEQFNGEALTRALGEEVDLKSISRLSNKSAQEDRRAYYLLNEGQAVGVAVVRSGLGAKQGWGMLSFMSMQEAQSMGMSESEAEGTP